MRIATCVFAVVLTLLAAPQGSHALVGLSQTGGPASAHTVVVLRSYKNTSAFCSGVLIAPRVVLTAGHCARPANQLAVLVSPTSHDLIAVAASVVNPRYVANAERKRAVSIDLALLRLDRNLPASFSPIQIETSGLIRLDQEFTIAGFGLREEGGEPSKELRFGKLVSRSPLSNILLWAKDPGNRGFGACTGDSGGPIFDAGVTKLVAITVWSAGAAGRKCGDLTQGILVGPQIDWIGKTLQQWSSR